MRALSKLSVLGPLGKIYVLLGSIYINVNTAKGTSGSQTFAYPRLVPPARNYGGVMGWKAQFESWPNMIWTAIRHWFFEFKMCDGCRLDIREKWNPTLEDDED